MDNLYAAYASSKEMTWLAITAETQLKEELRVMWLVSVFSGHALKLATISFSLT